ncbi:MAG: branched-chain amino acid ABC transporter permease [Candidatus Limnocylindrus sp.]|nr:MAG: branched-chain amino acid ABC transporter permease [Candidatus Limnocylindrus sp.]
MPPVQFVNALTLGAIYALIALGYTMVYGIVELINFAHGDVFMLGTFVSLSILIDVMAVTGPITNPLQLTAVLIFILAVTMGLMGAVGFLIEKLAYRPLRNAPKLAPLITAIGVSFILQNIVQLWKGPYKTNFPQFFPMDAALMFGSVRIGLINVLVIAVALILMIALQLFITRSKTGRAMRATALDPTAAALMGVNIDATISRTFVIGAAIAGAGSVMFGLYLGITDFSIGFLAGLKAFTAAVVGGIGNTLGAALGAFTIGFTEVGATVAGFSRWKDAIVFILLVAFLTFRPNGILGSDSSDRA